MSTRTLYPVTAAPPLLTGTVQLTTARAFPGVADTAVGAPGTVFGVTATLATDTSELPATLAAVTVNVYAVPLVKPVTVTVVPIIVLALNPPGNAVTVYPVIADPPLLTGAVQPTTASALPATAVTPVGAPGTVLGVTEVLADDATEDPATLAAVTVNVYAVPFVKPVTVRLAEPATAGRSRPT